MSRSYKKQRITKDIDKYNKKLGNKKLRRITNQLLKLGNTESIPKKKREVQNDYDVTDWKIFWDLLKKEYRTDKIKGKYKRLIK